MKSIQNVIIAFVLIFAVSIVSSYALFSFIYSMNFSYHNHDARHEYMYGNESGGSMMSGENERAIYLTVRDTLRDGQMDDSNYACCLNTPCTYCLEKTPGHGEGASCHCLDDVMNGRHPCGECIGEILEGHGNWFLKAYFAPAIAEEVGEEYLAVIQQIIDEKYSE